MRLQEMVVLLSPSNQARDRMQHLWLGDTCFDILTTVDDINSTKDQSYLNNSAIRLQSQANQPASLYPDLGEFSHGPTMEAATFDLHQEETGTFTPSS